MTEEIDDFSKKMAYMYCIEEVLAKPNEIWYHPDDGITYYLLKYEGDVTIVVKVKGEEFIDFDVFHKDFSKINELRYGILKFAEE